MAFILSGNYEPAFIQKYTTQLSFYGQSGSWNILNSKMRGMKEPSMGQKNIAQSVCDIFGSVTI